MPITSTGVWTNNYEAIKRYWAVAISPGSKNPLGRIVEESGSALYGIYDQSYNAFNLPIKAISNSARETGFSAFMLHLVLGGEQRTSEPAKTDHTIYGPIRNTSIVKYVNATSTYIPNVPQEEGYYKLGIRSAVTIQNQTANPITVYEWGLYTSINASVSQSSGTAYRDVLLYRGVLSEPVTLGQYDTITINFDRYMKVALQESETTP